MLTNLLDFFCSQPFSDAPKGRARLWVVCNAFVWVLIATITGFVLCKDVAMQGQNAAELLVMTGSAPMAETSYPLLQGLASLFLGASPSMLAINLFGAVLVGFMLSMTWLLTFFWMRDAMTDDSIVGNSYWVSIVGAHLVCVLFLFSIGGLYTVSLFNKDVWCFGLLLLCAVLQNVYAINGGHRWMMGIFALVLGMALMESPWVTLFMPLFLVRTLMFEWRLWDHSVRNLAIWVLGILAGAALVLVYGASCLDQPLMEGISRFVHDLPRIHYYYVRSLFADGWLLLIALSVIVPFLAWVTARRLLNNDRKWGLLFTAIVLTGAILSLSFGLLLSPIKVLLAAGLVPMATTWSFAVAGGMLTVGWGVQLFARNPNLYEEMDRRHMPSYVRALRVGALILFPMSLLCSTGTLVVQGSRFSSVDHGLLDRFALETIDLIAPGSGTPAEGHTYILGSAWIDTHLRLMANKRGVPVVILSPDRSDDAQYIKMLEEHLLEDPALGEIDRKRLTNQLTKHGLLLFLTDFFAAQSNIADIAVVYNHQEAWRESKLLNMQPMPYGTIYLGVPEGIIDPMPAYEAWKGLLERWVPVVQNTSSEWYETNARNIANIRHHLAFMSNNMGVFMDDQSILLQNATTRLAQEAYIAEQAGKSAEAADLAARRDATWEQAKDYHQKAADCYLRAREIDPKNISALLNLADICRSNEMLLPERREEVKRELVRFTEKSIKEGRKYSLPGIQRVYGTIRNEALLVNYGPIWSLNNAPETLLAGLYNAQSRLAPTDPRNALVQSAIAGIRELQGQMELAVEDYRAALRHNPKDVNALRALARLSLQEGNLSEAEKLFAEAEKAFDEATVGQPETEQLKATRGAFDLDRAAYYMVKGDLANANKMLGVYTTENPNSAIGWAMLGMLKIEDWERTGNEQSLRDASGYILQSVKRAVKKDSSESGNTELYFQYILEARLAHVEATKQEKRSQDMNLKNAKLREDAAKSAVDAWRKARNNYRHARVLRPHVKGILELILDLDRRLLDRDAAEVDAIALLREDPRHALANFIVGAQRLEDGDVNAAIIYFKNAVEDKETPTVDVVTNYADALSRTTQTELACQMGKRATELAPMSYATWGTYALTLARSQRVAEAKEALAQAHQKIEQAQTSGVVFMPDPRLAFVNVWIAIAEQNRAEAEAQVVALRKALEGSMTELDKLDFQDVERAIHALPQ